MTNPLLLTFIVLIFAYVFGEAFRYFGFPRVVGQILAGIVLGLPLIKSMLFTNEILSVFSFMTSIGMILLFFFVGLEINLFQFKKNFRKASLVAVFNTLIPLTSGFLAGKFLFGFDNVVSLIIGISLSVSSEAISLDILEELKLLKSKIGNLIIASGTVDDVFELLLISSLLVVFHSTVIGQFSFQKLMLGISIFTLIVILFRILLIPFALKVFERENSQSTLFMGALIIVLSMAYLSELYGISSLIGALIAGILVRQTLVTGKERKPWRRNEISHSIHIISWGFLIPLFFVNVGLSTDIGSLSANFPLFIVLLLIGIFGTLAGTITGVLLGKGTVREGYIVGWGVIPKGDTELVIATVALNSGLIGIGVYTAIIMVALSSTFLAPVVFKYLIRKHEKVTAA